MNTFYFSGTLGDAFLVLCKAYNYGRQTGRKIALQRLSRHIGMDNVIKELFDLLSFVDYKMPCIYIENGKEIKQKLKGSMEDYINGERTEIESGDPPGFEMEPYPQLKLPNITIDTSKLKLGIQLHSGKRGSNFRGFSLGWVVKLRRKLPKDKFKIYLFGTGDGYVIEDIQQLCAKYGIENYIGQTTFLEWMACIQAMNAFITLEGFSAFFAMSQKVPTIMYNQYAYKLDGSIHPEWRETNAIININLNKFLGKIRHIKIKYFKRKNLYSPRNLKFIKKVIRQNILKD